jgi:hypothetical protein
VYVADAKHRPCYKDLVIRATPEKVNGTIRRKISEKIPGGLRSVIRRLV